MQVTVKVPETLPEDVLHRPVVLFIMRIDKSVDDTGGAGSVSGALERLQAKLFWPSTPLARLRQELPQMQNSGVNPEYQQYTPHLPHCKRY